MRKIIASTQLSRRHWAALGVVICDEAVGLLEEPTAAAAAAAVPVLMFAAFLTFTVLVFLTFTPSSHRVSSHSYLLWPLAGEWEKSVL